MKKKWIVFASIGCVALVAIVVLATVIVNKLSSEKNLIVHLEFNQKSGNLVKDSAGTLPDVEMNYLLSHAAFTTDQDPIWVDEGIKNNCILMDGTSTFIAYKKTDITISGPTYTFSAWIAPRTFEWDDPNAAENGNDNLTGIISQSNKAKKQGVLLGYERFGRLSFQVGTGDEWLTVWTNGDNLKKYEWNNVVAVFDAPNNTMALYLNGELVASRSVESDAVIAGASNKPLIIGRNGESERLVAGFTNVCSGYLDEVKIYDAALTTEKIAKQYNKVKVPDITFEKIWLQNVLTEDYTRPQFHAAPYQFWMNEPHAPFYYNGKYHLFFQENMSGSYWRNICWGHFVSDDTVNWKPVKEAITPTEGTVVPDGVWSGNATYDKNGVPLLFFTAGNDSFIKDELHSNQNIGVAYPADLEDEELIEWNIYKELAVIQKPGQGRLGEFRDPSIWKNGDTWYMFICSGSTKNRGGSILLYETKKLELLSDGTIDMDWQYKGVVYEMENPSIVYGTSWELPIVLPIENQAGTISKFVCMISPAPASVADNKVYYWVGDFDVNTGKFTPDEEFGDMPRNLDYGCNVFTGPSAFLDERTGEISIFSIMQDQRGGAEQGTSGWAHTAGITRNIWLSDDGRDVMIAPSKALDSIKGDTLIDEKQITLEEANSLLAKIDEDMYYLQLEVDCSKAEEFGINLKKGGKWDCTTYTYDVVNEMINGETQNKGEGASSNYASGSLKVEDGTLRIEIFVDRSLVEAFFNDSKAFSIRSYTEEQDSRAIDVFASGDVQINRLVVSPMKSIFK